MTGRKGREAGVSVVRTSVKLRRYQKAWLPNTEEGLHYKERAAAGKSEAKEREEQ